jgi:alkylation response protein AidB-like acyl-CoA dehydrogenase
VPIAISETHREIESVARSFLEKARARSEARALLDSPDEVMPPFWDELVALGWMGLHVPEQYGGGGYGFPELVLILQEFGRSLAPGPFLPTVLASSVIAETGDDGQKSTFLPALADGTRSGSVGWDGALVLENGELNGDGGLCLGAGLADLFVLTVGPDLVIVDRETPGLSVNALSNLDPTRRCARIEASHVLIDDARIVRDGSRVAIDIARLLMAAEAVGGAQECVERASEYAKQRQQFGRPIGMFQAVKHHCANMLVASELATAAVWDAARAAQAGGDQLTLAAAVAASQALPAFFRNSQLNIQVHGGIGFTWEHDAHMLLRRATSLVALGDPDSAARDVTAQGLAGTKRELGLDLPPEAEAIRSTVRQDAQEIAALPAGKQRARLIETGYIQPHWPRPWGRASKALEQLVIDEEFARAKIARPQFGITGWNILTVIQHGTPDQIDRWVKATLEGELVWCQLFSEPDAGSDAAGIRTKGTRVEGGFLVTGQKVWTSGAQYAHRGLATVRTNPDVPKHNGITTMVIDMHAEGVEVRPLREASGASMFNEVFFNDVFVPDDDVVGPVDGGWTVARSTLGNERVSIGGGSGVPLELDVVSLYRDRLNAPSSPAMSDLSVAVGQHSAEGQTMKLLNVRAAERAVAGGEPGPEGNVTKLLSAEHMQRSADLALRLLGPEMATPNTQSFMAAQVLIFSRAMSIAGGTSEITRNQIGERILGLPRDPLVQ